MNVLVTKRQGATWCVILLTDTPANGITRYRKDGEADYLETPASAAQGQVTSEIPASIVSGDGKYYVHIEAGAHNISAFMVVSNGVVDTVRMARDSAPGADRSLRPMGEYDYGTLYSRMDLVSYNGSSYLALGDSQGVWPTDTTRWMLMAAKGDEAGIGEVVHVGEVTPPMPIPIWMDTSPQPGGWVETPGGADWRQNVAFYFEENLEG